MWLASIIGGVTLILAILYYVLRGVWLCFWDSYIAEPLRENEKLKRSIRLTGGYYQGGVIDEQPPITEAQPPITDTSTTN